MSLDEIDQLIRMTQVIRVRANLLTSGSAAAKIKENGSGRSREAVALIEAAADLAIKAQGKLERARSNLS